MSESKDFLARWSRRKREAIAEESQAPAKDAQAATPSEPAAQSAPARPSDPDNPLSKQSEPEFDLSKLPSLDAIGPETDIRMFLQPGVPAALSSAALRRAWSADPAIRDFIGLSENSWDFTAPDSIHGFGPLAPTDDVKRLLAQVFNENISEPAAPSGDDALQPDSVRAESKENIPAQPQKFAEAETSQEDADLTPALSSTNDDSANDDLLHRNKFDGASQQDRGEFVPVDTRPRRKHGGALPT